MDANEHELHDVRGWAAGSMPRRRAVPGGKPPVRMVDGGTLTYAEADRLADRVARGLARLGLGAGDRVAVRLPDGIESATSS